jgi:ABC-type phosphate transport system substrate-binding protein
MTSEPLDIAIQAAKLTGATVDSSKLKIYVVTTQEVAFVVNRANPVSKLTWDQMRDIQTGVIRTWDMVGGSKAIINVYAGKSGRGTRALVKSKIMHDLEFMKATIEEETIERAAELVSNDPAGFAAVGIQFAKKFPLKTIESEKLRRPIGFIADHELSENEKKLVKAYDSLFHATP